MVPLQLSLSTSFVFVLFLAVSCVLAGSPPPTQPPAVGASSSTTASDSLSFTASTGGKSSTVPTTGTFTITATDTSTTAADTSSDTSTDESSSSSTTPTSETGTSISFTSSEYSESTETASATTTTATTDTFTSTETELSLPTGITLGRNNTEFSYIAPADSSSSSKLVYTFGLNGFPHFRISYFAASVLPTTESTFASATFSWRAGIFRVVEFNDSISIAESTSFISFVNKSSQWSPIQVSTATGSSQEANTTFIESGFVMIITAHISKMPMSVQGMTFRPDSLKYSIGFSGFPYKLENSSLAIVKAEGAVAKFSVISFNCKHDGGICIGGGRGVMYWTPTAQLDHAKTAPISYDGQVTPLSSLVSPSELSHINSTSNGTSEEWGATVFTIPTNRSNLFFWDPEMTIDKDLVNSAVNSGVEAGMSAMSSACATCATVVGGLIGATTSTNAAASTSTGESKPEGTGASAIKTTTGSTKPIGSFADSVDAWDCVTVVGLVVVLVIQISCFV